MALLGLYQSITSIAEQNEGRQGRLNTRRNIFNAKRLENSVKETSEVLKVNGIKRNKYSITHLMFLCNVKRKSPRTNPLPRLDVASWKSNNQQNKIPLKSHNRTW